MTAPITGPPAPFPQPAPAASRWDPTRWRRWVIALVAAATGLLFGLAYGVGGTALFQRLQGEREFEVVVALEKGITEEQRAAARAAIGRVAPGAVTLRTSEENYKAYVEDPDSNPDVVRQLRPEDVGETFVFRTRGTDFDCGPVPALRTIGGVTTVTVHAEREGDRPEIFVACPD